MSFWLDEITIIRSLTRLSTMLNTVPLDQKSTLLIRQYFAILTIVMTLKPIDVALHEMLEKLSDSLSVGLYLPINRADEVPTPIMNAFFLLLLTSRATTALQLYAEHCS